MRGYFDNDEPEVEEPEELEDRRHDTEVTLTTGAQLGIVFCLLLLCGLCFGLGYWVGHRGSPAVAEKTATQPATPTAAPDQEPLQGSDTLPKPSADAHVPPTQPPDESGGTPPAPASDTSPAPAQPQPTPAATPPHTPMSSPAPTAPKPAPSEPARPSTPVRSANPARTDEPPSEQTAPAMRPAYPSSTTGYMVQIAAVSHAEDAFVLVNALRNRGFMATAQHMPDGLIHVRIGPFTTHEEASRMSARLLGDGYNAMVQP